MLAFIHWALIRVMWYSRDGETRPFSEMAVLYLNELNAVKDNVSAYISFQKSEKEILTERLGRRYDIGLAMNESAQRAMEEKKYYMLRELSGKQKAALEFQAKYLQSLVNKS